MDGQEDLLVVNETASSTDGSKILVPIAVLSFLALAMLYAVIATDDGTDPGPGFEPYLVKWESKPDGSQYSSVYGMPFENAESVSDSRAVSRCWSAETGFVCLHVVKTDVVGGVTHISLSEEDALPELLLPTFYESGYNCSTVLGSLEESIGNGKVPLTSNQLRSLDDRWSRKFVTKFMADNNVDGQWFDCLTVLREVSSGSLETLGTTLITRSVLPQG